jgi:ribonuclease J
MSEKIAKDKLLFLPLGGAGEIGMNVNLYHYEGKWLMVDCGAGFADDHLPGIDMIVADLSFIAKRKDDLVGLVLTHAHEDHLGGVQYLWNELGCPIYSTKFTGNFLKARLQEYHFEEPPVVNFMETGSKFDLGPFNIEMISITHSAPEMQGLMIRTKAGNILHTGDWKFDDNPVVGPATDYEALKKCGEEGVLALVCDSTNVFNKEHSGSEGDLNANILELVKECQQMVVVTTFASNLGRLETLLNVAKQAGRKVVIAGRSILRVIEVAEMSGYDMHRDIIINDRDVTKYKRHEVMVISTGCQGEPLAATSKIAHDVHQSLKLIAGDMVIFSSKIIPGNEKRIFRLFNIFAKKNIDVITEKDHAVHVSGHPGVPELKRMYEIVKPRISIPVHGELVHIQEHAKLAKSWNVPFAVKVENGALVDLNPDNPTVIDHVHSGYLAIDGNYLINTDSRVIKMRRKMRDAGLVLVNVILNRAGSLVLAPIIAFPGCLDKRDDESLIDLIRQDVFEAFAEMAGGKKTKTNENIETLVRSVIKRALKSELGKMPMIEVQISRI